MDFMPFKKMQERVHVDLNESDSSLFLALMYHGEFLTKLTVAALLSALTEERDRHRYRLIHSLVRADSIGDWDKALDDLLIGPASQYVDHLARDEKRQLTQRVVATEWQHQAAALLNDCLRELDIERECFPTKVSARRWFSDFVQLRNKTRGHGATRGSLCARVCERLQQSITLLASNLVLFQRPWAYLHRNLSGKYRVTHLAGDAAPFNPFKSQTEVSIPDGVYIYFSEPRRVELLKSDPEATDFFLPNGGFTAKRYDLLSYITGDTVHDDPTPYQTPSEELPRSESQGIGQLDVYGHCFSNLPPAPKQYIERPVLESELLEQLNVDRHPIVTLTGPGGIGKTYLALKVLHQLVTQPAERFTVVVWFSARDIDLLPEGPKLVRPHVLSINEFAVEYVRLAEPAERAKDDFKAAEFLKSQMSHSDLGPILFVFDNFETVKNPADIFSWIDTFVRAPNKVLITTRKREFAGDYPIHVSGMSEDECAELISTAGGMLGITGLLTDEYREELYRESDGHPYVVKILLGEIARHRQRRKVQRIIAGQDTVLTALFERTYSMLSPASQRVFLTLCNWRSTIPEIALEAVLLRPQNERINFRDAVSELVQSSFVEEIVPDGNDVVLDVPLAAWLFGKRKLEVSPWKAAVVADGDLLRFLGVGKKTDAKHGVNVRLERLFRAAATGITSEDQDIGQLKPVLEFIANSYPDGWLLLADLYKEEGPAYDLQASKECVRRYLEAPKDDSGVSRVWKRLADLCRDTQDVRGEIHALTEMCKAASVPTHVVSNAANRINRALREGNANVPAEELRALLAEVIGEMERRSEELSPDDCSRLSWLYLQIHDRQNAMRVAGRGLQIDSENPHCASLAERLSEG